MSQLLADKSKDFIMTKSKYLNLKIGLSKRKTFIDIKVDKEKKLPGPADIKSDLV